MGEFYTRLGAILHERRRALGLHQGEVAKRLGVHRVTYANMERGAQSLAFHQVLLLSQILDLPLTQLIETLQPQSAPSFVAPAFPVAVEQELQRLRAEEFVTS